MLGRRYDFCLKPGKKHCYALLKKLPKKKGIAEVSSWLYMVCVKLVEVMGVSQIYAAPLLS